jgi:hypothetical protein
LIAAIGFGIMHKNVLAHGSPSRLGLDPKKNSYSLDGGEKGLLILGREGDGSVFFSQGNAYPAVKGGRRQTVYSAMAF